MAVTPTFSHVHAFKKWRTRRPRIPFSLESKEEGELSEALKRNLLLEVFIFIPVYGVIYFFPLYSLIHLYTVKDKVDTLPKQVIPEPGIISVLRCTIHLLILTIEYFCAKML